MKRTLGNSPGYLLISRDPPEGFFSNYFFVLEGIIEARRRGLDPIIGFPINIRAASKDRRKKVERWSDFFDIDDQVNNEILSVPGLEIHSKFVGTLKDFSPGEISRLSRNHLPLKASLQEELDSAAERILGNGKGGLLTLGVHFRGGDMYWNPNHPTPPTQSQMIQVVQKVLENSKFGSVFVATDQRSFVRKLRRKVNLPVFTHTHSRLLNWGWRSRGFVKEVLLDAHTLSKCHGLVHTGSGVSVAARMYRTEPYMLRAQVSLGVNPSSLREAILKALWRITLPDKLLKETPEVKFETLE